MCSQENTAHLAELFSHFLASDNELIKSTESEIHSFLQSNRLEFLCCCSAIIMNDSNQSQLVFFAIKFIIITLTPFDRPLDFVRNWWLNVNDELKSHIREALLRGILFKEDYVTNMASKAICTLALIDQIDFFPTIEKIVYLVHNEDEQYNSEQFQLSALFTLNEIIAPPYFGTLAQQNIPPIKEMISKINHRMLELFVTSFSTKSLPYREKLAMVLNTLIMYASPLYTNKDFVNVIINTVSGLICQENCSLGLYETFCQILYNLTLANYDETAFPFESINGIILDQIMIQHSLDKLSISIQFYFQLSKFEYRLLQDALQFNQLVNVNVGNKYQIKQFETEIKPRIITKIQRPRISKNLTKILVSNENLVNRLLTILTFIDPSHTYAERNEEPESAHKYSTNCLLYFFRLNPRTIFQYVCMFWTNYYQKYNDKGNPNYDILLDQNLPWTIKHALLLTVSIISSKIDNYELLNPDFCEKSNFDLMSTILGSFEYDPSIFSDIKSFLMQPSIIPSYSIYYNFVLKAINAPIPRIVDTALYTVKIIQKSEMIGVYDTEIEIDGCHTSFEYLIRSFQTIISSTEYDEVIFKRMLYGFTAFFDKESLDAKMILPFQNEILGIIQMGLDPPGNSYEIYDLTIRVLDCFIVSLSDQSILYTIYQKMFSVLMQLKKHNLNDVVIVKIRETLNIVNSICRNNRFQLNEQDLSNLFGIISELLDTNKNVYEDCLTCLIIMIKKFGVNSDAVLQRIMAITPDSLESQSPSVITKMIVTIGYLYKYYYKKNECRLHSMLIDEIPNYVQMILRFLNDENTNFTREFYPPLLISLARILSTATELVNYEQTQEILALYLHFAQKDINVKDVYEVEFGNEIYQAIFAGLIVILKIYSNQNPEAKKELTTKDNCRKLISYVPSIFQKFPKYTDKSLKQYCKYFLELKAFLRFRGNALLRKDITFIPLLYAFTYLTSPKDRHLLEETIKEILKA